METKEQLLIGKVLDEMDHMRNTDLIKAAMEVINRNEDDKIYLNDENGLDEGLEGFSPSYIVYSIIGEDSEYDPKDPFFITDIGIKSLDIYDLQRDFPGRLRGLADEEVTQYLDKSDVIDVFDDYVKEHHPEVYDSIDFDELDTYSVYDLIDADWDDLCDKLSGGPKNESTMERRIRTIVNESVRKALRRL